MECHELRTLLLDLQRSRLADNVAADARRHLDGCADCTHAAAVEHELTRVLEHRTPQYPAPIALKRRLASTWPAASPVGEPRRARPWLRLVLPTALAAAIALLIVPVTRELVAPKSSGPGVMVNEAVNDHVRMVQSQRPLEVESSGAHQVVPWFSGRLDFAPRIRFPGDADFPLRGGAIGYFVDRRAATLVFGRRLHSISLFVFKADGLPWPSGKLEPLGRVELYQTSARGFTVLLWREGDLGYALVSDVNARDLMLLASKLAPPV
jgi:anti-sigma factor RsiW